MRINLWFLKLNLKAKHLINASDAKLVFRFDRYMILAGIGLHLYWLYKIITNL